MRNNIWVPLRKQDGKILIAVNNPNDLKKIDEIKALFPGKNLLFSVVVSRIKIMPDLDIAERRKPPDGKIKFKKYGGKDIELRVATVPTQGGLEDIVMRILAAGSG